MANTKYTNGTLFMALEEGASWPQFMRHLRKTAGNVQAVVQTPGEPAEAFADRVLTRWRALVTATTPPFRFVLGTNESWDLSSTAARRRLAHAAMGARDDCGPSELILWGGNLRNCEEQGKLLALAGALVEGQTKSARNVRVLFREPQSVTKPLNQRHVEQAPLRVA